MSTPTHPEVFVRPLVEQFQLANGLNILVQPDFSAPVVSVQFWVETGSIHETPWLGSGISHLLEHLMFKGTPTRGNSQMAQDIQKLGGHLNAYTSFDRTVYYVDLPSDNAVSAMEILGDAVFNSTLPEDEYDKEMEVIRREFAMGKDNPDSELGKLLFQTAYMRHPYRYPVIGYLDLFNQLERKNVLHYYHSRYSPQNVTLVVCGAVNPTTIFKGATEHLSKYTRRPLVDFHIPTEPIPLGPRTCRQPFTTELTRTAFSWHIPGLNHPHVPALDLLATILGGGRSSRLNLVCVEKLGLAEQIDAFAYAPVDQGILGIEARCQPERETELLKEIRRQVEIATQEAPHEQELDRAVRLNVLYYVNSQKTMSGKASLLGRSWHYLRDPHFIIGYYEALEQTTPEQVLEVAKLYLRPEHEITVALVPEPFLSLHEKPLPDHAEAPVPQKLAASLRSIYVPQKQVALYSARAVLPGGLLAEPSDKPGLGRLAAHLLTKGTRNRTAEQLSREIEQLGGSLAADMGINSAYLTLELLSSEWSEGLDLFLEMLTESAPTEAELDTEKRKQLSLIQAERDYPMAVARDLIRNMLYADHPYRLKSLGTAESVQAITLKDVNSYLETQLLTQDIIFGVSGPIDSPLWIGAAEKSISRLAPVRGRNQVVMPPKLQGPVRKEEIVQKQQAVLQIAFPTVPLTHTDHIGLAILDEALSDLGSRLFIRIREQLGLAYFVGTTQFFGLAASHFVFYVGTDPNKRQQIEEALLEEIQRLSKEGITEPEIVRARAKLQSNEKLEQQNASHLVSVAALDELFGLGYDYQQTRRARMAEIDLAAVNEIAARYFSSPNFATAIVSPH